MAVDMFIKIGDIKGEAQDQKHKGEIDVLSWSWSAINNGSAHLGGGGGSGKVHVHDLSFTKYMDKASPSLLLACCSGKHFPQACLTFRKAGAKPVEYCKIKLTQVLISSVGHGGSGSEDRLTEQVSLNFSKVDFEYTPQEDSGAPWTAIPMSWDIAANTRA
jgi:type VI secretion system secreted protein Hcp